MSAKHLKSAVTGNQQMSSGCVMLCEATFLFQKPVCLNRSGDGLGGFHFLLVKACGSLNLLIAAEFIVGISVFLGRWSFDFLT